MRIGLLGGTFDPIHYAHLAIAEEARVLFGLEKVLFIPNRVPPHKQREVAAPEHRLAMVELAVAPNPAFECSRIEMDRPGRSYTVDTLAELHRRLPGAEMYFITGTDALAEIATWRSPGDVARQAILVAVERGGWSLRPLLATLSPAIAARVRPLPAVPLTMSSTEVRERVREGRPIRYLTPDDVVAYIHSHRLYRIAPHAIQAG